MAYKAIGGHNRQMIHSESGNWLVADFAGSTVCVWHHRNAFIVVKKCAFRFGGRRRSRRVQINQTYDFTYIFFFTKDAYKMFQPVEKARGGGSWRLLV